MTRTDPAEISALVRSVIVTFGLPFDILSVTESLSGWNIHVRAGTGGLVHITVPDGRPLVMRHAIRELL
ncbi:MAG: hypothetical protein ABW292_14030, partial [Vicinamibacterales bacterium]